MLSRMWRWMRWVKSSEEEFYEAETRVLQSIKTPFKRQLVDCGNGRYLNTIETHTSGIPVVLMHGWGAGLGYWVHTIDSLAASYKVFAVDWLGFGRSSRTPFCGSTTEEAEDYWCESLEEWRRQNGLEKFVLIGHSLGGYLAACYALRYEEHVAKLILVSPVGIPERVIPSSEPSHSASATPDPENSLSDENTPLNSNHSSDNTAFEPGEIDPSGSSDGHRPKVNPHVHRRSRRSFPWYVRLLGHVIWSLTPQTLLRMLGPWGPSLIQRYVDLRFKEGTVPEGFADYTYHLNAHSGTSSGPTATKYILGLWAYALKPLHNRLNGLRLPISLVYGDRDWMDADAGRELADRLNETRQIANSRAELSPLETVTMSIISDAGHHLYLDNPDVFNSYLLDEIASYTCALNIAAEFGARNVHVPPIFPDLIRHDSDEGSETESIPEELEELVIPNAP